MFMRYIAAAEAEEEENHNQDAEEREFKSSQIQILKGNEDKPSFTLIEGFQFYSLAEGGRK